MSYWMFDVVALVVPALLLLRGRQVLRRTWQATGALAAIALVHSQLPYPKAAGRRIGDRPGRRDEAGVAT